MKRPVQHVLETKSFNALRRLIPAEWILTEKVPDYGIDMEVIIVKNNEVTNKVAWIQLKATSSLGNIHPVDTKNLIYYELCHLPVILLYWIETENAFYYILVQKYINEELNIQNPEWREQKTIKLNFKDELKDPMIIENLADEGFEYIIENLSKPFIDAETCVEELFYNIKNVYCQTIDKIVDPIKKMKNKWDEGSDYFTTDDADDRCIAQLDLHILESYINTLEEKWDLEDLKKYIKWGRQSWQIDIDFEGLITSIKSQLTDRFIKEFYQYV